MLKIKETVEDFVVSEVADIFPEHKGEYALYVLKKFNISTWDALGEIAKLLRISMNSIGFGGLKDKRAIANQFITIKNGPKKDIKAKDFQLIYLGQTTKPMSKELLLGNKFEIMIKNFSVEEKKLIEEVELIRRWGVPNYFDEQRFGSVKISKEFAAKEIIKGNYEKALYLLLVEGSPSEIERTRKLRDCLKKNWRNFEKCIDLAPLNWVRELLKFLSEKRPSKRTFKRALNMVDQEYLFFLGNAYQSYLWNEILKEVLITLKVQIFEISYILGTLYFYKTLTQNQHAILRSLKLPLPCPKLRFDEDGGLNLFDIYEKICQREGFSGLQDLRTFIKGLVFKTYPRPVIVFPEDLAFEKLDKATVKLTFFLEKGSYATLVVKRIYYGCKNS